MSWHLTVPSQPHVKNNIAKFALLLSSKFLYSQSHPQETKDKLLQTTKTFLCLAAVNPLTFNIVLSIVTKSSLLLP